MQSLDPCEIMAPRIKFLVRYRFSVYTVRLLQRVLFTAGSEDIKFLF